MAEDANDTDRGALSSEALSPFEVRELLARLTKLEDERAIIEVLHRYGQAADEGDDHIWANLFTEDGVFLCIDRAGHTLIREQGREALSRWLRGFRASEKLITKHCVLAPVVTIDGNRATVKSYLTRISENPDPLAPPFLLLMGQYRDEMIKGTDGHWRFEQRTARTEAPFREQTNRPSE